MNIKTALFFAISVMIISSVRADEVTYVNILKERDATLSELLANQEAKHTQGSGSMEDVESARLALWTFRRDMAKSNIEKINLQEAIIGVYEKLFANLKATHQSGATTNEQLLQSRDKLLQAKQLLEELRMKEPVR